MTHQKEKAHLDGHIRDLDTPSQPMTPDHIPPPHQGAILYDRDCPLCLGLIARVSDILTRYGWVCLPLQDPIAQPLSSLSLTDLQRAITVCPQHGTARQGVDALAIVLASIPRTRVISWWLQRPALKPLWQWVYGIIARHRHTLSRLLRLTPPAQG